MATAAVIAATSLDACAQQPAPQWRPDPATDRYLRGAQDPERWRPARPAIDLPTVAARPAPAAGAQQSFRLSGVSVHGAVSLPPDALSAAYGERIGTLVTESDIAAIAENITALYRQAGFHLSRAIVPVQNIRNGAIRIDVVEGAVDEVVVKGPARDVFGVRSVLDPIAREAPARSKTMERQLLLVNEIPGVRVMDTALEEIGTATGRFRLHVTVDTWRIYWAQGIDNLGSAVAGPLQAYSGLSLNSLLVSGDNLAVAGTTIPDEPGALSFGRLSYDLPVDVNGSRIGFTAMQSAVRPTDVRRLAHDATRTTGYELRGSILPLQARDTALRLTAAFGISDVSETDDFGTYYRDRIRTISLAADYRLKDDLDGWNYFTVILRQGLKVLGASHQEDLTSVYGASGDFTTVNLSYVRLQRLTDIWSIKLATSAQFASNTLLLSQQYFLGSAGFGPGFYGGDNGVSGTTELRFDQETNLAWLKGYQIYGFVDGGQVWNAAGGRASLASVGAGTRFFVNDQLQAGVSVGVPVHNSFDYDEPDFRILFTVHNAFRICPDKPKILCG